MNPSLGRNFEALDPLEWLARMSDHIPDPARGAGRRDAVQMPEASAEPPRRRSSPTWARLIAKIYQVDPLVRTRCGRKMQMIAFLTEPALINRILDHLPQAREETRLRHTRARRRRFAESRSRTAELLRRSGGERVLHQQEEPD